MLNVFTSHRREWSINDIARLVRTHERFSMLSEKDAVSFVQHMHPLRVTAGGTVFREGRTDSNFMAVILEGEARAESDGGGLGEKVMLGTLKEGDLIGEQGILQETPRSATVTAVTDLMLAAIDTGKFDKMVKANPALGCSILTSLLRTVTLRLFDANQRVYVLEDSQRKLKKELELEISCRQQLQAVKEVPPLVFSEDMFQPTTVKKA